MKLLFSMIVLLVSQSSFAQMNSCLAQVSNQDLLREMGRRMSYPAPPYSGGGRSDISISFVCAGNAEIIIDSINTANGQASQLKIATGNWDTCRSYANTLASKISNGSASRKIFAICGYNAEVSKYTITADGQIVLSSKSSTGNWDTCHSIADQVNSSL